MAIQDMAIQTRNSTGAGNGVRPAESSAVSAMTAGRVGSATGELVLVICCGLPDAPLRSALPMLGPGARMAHGQAAARSLVAEFGHAARVVTLFGAACAAPALDLLETMRAQGVAAPLLMPPSTLPPADLGILQEAGVELLGGLTADRQVRALRERLDAAMDAPSGVRRGERRGDLSLDSLAAGGDAMARAVSQGKRALRTGLPVLVEGPQGAGKLMLVRALHAAGMRRQRPLRQLDVTMLSAGVRSAMATLGVDMERGLVQGEPGGSLYFRQIDAWSSSAQADLAELLRRRGARHNRATTEAPLRIFAGARQSLIDLVRAGDFREDLYYLLSVAPLTLPALRHRPSDIAPLASAMLERLHAGRAGRLLGAMPERFSDAALQRLAAEQWPGNAGELRARVLRAVHASSGPVISAADVAPPRVADAEARASFDARAEIADARPAYADDDDLMHAEPAAFGSGPDNRDTSPGSVWEPELGHNLGQHFRAASNMWSGGEASGPIHDYLDIFDGHGDLRPLAEIEAGVIRFAVRHYRGQMSEVSRKLGIGRSTLYRKLKELDTIKGLDPIKELDAMKNLGAMPHRTPARAADPAQGWPEGAAAQPA